MRWILVDRFLSFDGALRARAVKNVSMGEDFVSTHFAELAIFPGSLVLEALAQTGGILVARAEKFAHKVILAKVERARFETFARPGDQILLEATVVERRDEGFKVDGRAVVREPAHEGGAGQERLIAEATLMFVNLGGQQAGAELAENFVFTPSFLSLFRGLDAGEASGQPAERGL